jgi:hypothetical protein
MLDAPSAMEFGIGETLRKNSCGLIIRAIVVVAVRDPEVPVMVSMGRSTVVELLAASVSTAVP